MSLNLIPREREKELLTKRIYIIIKKMIISFLFFSILLAIILLASRYLVEKELSEIADKNISSIESGRNTNNRILDINNKVDQIEKIQSGHHKWSTLLYHLSSITPENISYNFLNIQYQTSSLEIKGIAKTRNDLIEFEKKLKSSDIFTNVSLPINNLLAQTENSFTIKADINLEKIR
jgi:Tfp pilus assembly protein PilN